MAVSDRLYELSCECRDKEESLDRLTREVQRLEAIKRAALELTEALDDAAKGGQAYTEKVRSAMHSVLVLTR